MNAQNIYDYIRSEEANYKLPIDVMGWQWSMYDHIKQAFFYMHGRLLTGNSDYKPVKNITRPIINLNLRTEDLDVKDILLYIDDKNRYDLSIMAKRYHDDVFIQENDLDTFLDEANASRVIYGGALLKYLNSPKPEVVPLYTVAFCDQTDMLSGPIGIKHFYSPDQLIEMAKYGWGSTANGANISLEELITLAQTYKKNQDFTTNKTPGKYIEIYEIHGNMPEKFLRDTADEHKYINQIQIVAYYQKEGGGDQGVTLFKAKEKESPFDVILRDPIPGRALGFGGVEEIAENQTWTNYSQIKFREMLDAAAKTIFQTTDATFRRKVGDMDNLEVALLEPGAALSQVDTFPRNINLFEKYTQEWEAHAQMMGAANDSIMGESPTAGTPFKLQELVTMESKGLHEFRRGRFAKDIERIYKKWILPHIERKLKAGAEFLTSLSLEEMQQVAEKYVKRETERRVIENGGILSVNPEIISFIEQEVRDEFMRDNNKFFVIAKGELDNVSLKMKINVAGKQKNMATYTDKLVNIFRQIALSTNPQTGQSVLDDPRMAKLFNQILEVSGLEPIDFSTSKPQLPVMQNTQPQPMLNTNNQI